MEQLWLVLIGKGSLISNAVLIWVLLAHDFIEGELYIPV